jgi:hypothetical protein
MDTKKLIIEVAQQLLPIFIATNSKELGTKKGLCLAILDIDIPSIDNVKENIVTEFIGVIPENKLTEKQDFAIEKVLRLDDRNRNRRYLDVFELSSFDSEDEDKKQYGGGIRVKDFYLSASNFPPHLDQKFMLIVSVLCGQLTFTEAAKIDKDTFEKQRRWMSLPNKDTIPQ